MSTLSGLTEGEFTAEESLLEAQLELLTERLADLELSREDQGWIRLSGEGNDDFSRAGLREIAAIARLYSIKNPLIKRAVDLQVFYVWAQGISFVAKDDRVQQVVDKFLDDRKNQTELTSHVARTGKERDLMVSGNLFLAFFTNPSTGTVRVRSIPFSEIEDVVFNPEDRREPWFYLRAWEESRIEGAAITPVRTPRKAWYPDWRHTRNLPTELGGVEVRDVPVYHVKVGAHDGMRFGIPEVYAAIDWARGYKEFLTDWATLVKALSRFAWRATVKGGTAARTAATARLSRAPAAATEPQTNRATVGGTFVGSEAGASLEAIPKSGATTSADDGRRLLLMVAAATGNPETFFGDVSVGTLATATSLDRPTELKFRDRQTLWSDVLRDILEYVVDRAIEAPSGALDGVFVKAEDGEEGEGEWELAPGDPQPGEDPAEAGDKTVEVRFPPVLEHDVAGNVAAVVSAITLNGSPLEDVLMTPEQAARLVLQALNVDNAEEWLDEAFPKDAKGAPILRPDQQAKQDQALAIATATAKATPPPVAPNAPPVPPPGTAPAMEAIHEGIKELIRAIESSKGE